MANGIKFQIPEEVPEDFVPGQKLFDPVEFNRANFEPPPLESIEDWEGNDFEPPPLDSIEPLEEPMSEPATRRRPLSFFDATAPGMVSRAVEQAGDWEQRKREIKRGFLRAEQFSNLIGATIAGLAGTQTEEQLEKFREEGRTQWTDFEAQLEQDKAQIDPNTPPEEIEEWERKRRENFARTLEKRIEDNRQKLIKRVGAASEIGKRIAALPPSDVMKKFEEAGGTKEALAVIFQNPEVTLDLAFNSLPASLPGMAVGTVGGLTLGPVGTAAGAFTGALLPEVAGKMLEVMDEAGVDVTDPNQLQEFLTDPKKRAEALSSGIKKGLTISMVEAFFGGVAGRILGPAVRTGSPRRIVAAGLAEGAVGMTGEATGEALGQVASGGQIEGKELVAEAFGAFPNTIQETLSNIAGGIRQTRRQVVQPAQDAAAEAVETIRGLGSIAEQVARAQADLIRRGTQIGDSSIDDSVSGNLSDPDMIAAAQRQIIEQSNEAQAANAEINQEAANLQQDAQDQAEILGAANEVLASPEVAALNETQDAVERSQLYVDTVAELEKIDPQAAVRMKYPNAAAAFEAQQERLPGNALIEIENPDGTREVGLFSGYYAPNLVSFGAFKSDLDAFSHGIIDANKTRILTPIPTFEDWNAQQVARKQDALQKQEAEGLPQDQPAGGLQSLEEEIRDEGPAERQAALSQEVAGPQPVPDEFTFTVFAPEGNIPGSVQIERPTLRPDGTLGGELINPPQLLELGYDIPIIPEDLPSGKYTAAELRQIAQERAERGETVVGLSVSDTGSLRRTSPQQQAAQPPAEPRITPEEQRRREGEARRGVERAQSQAKARRLARIGLPADGEPDLLNFIQDHGGVPGPARDSGGEYDNFRETFTGIAQFLVNRFGRGSRYGPGGIDAWLKDFYNSSEVAFRYPIPGQTVEPNPYSPLGVTVTLPSNSTGQFYELVSQALAKRRDTLLRVKDARKVEKFEAAILGNEKRRKRDRADNPTRVGTLAIGDSFRINGEQFVVTDIDPDTEEVTVQDGIQYRLDDDQIFYPDKGSLVPAGRMRAQFFTPEEEAQLEAERQEEARAFGAAQAGAQQQELFQPPPLESIEPIPQQPQRVRQPRAALPPVVPVQQATLDLEPVGPETVVPEEPVGRLPGDPGRTFAEQFQDREQAEALDEFEGPLLPDRVFDPNQETVFVSGLSRSPSDMDAAIESGRPIGVAVSRPLTENIRRKIIDYAKTGGKVFIDSGAFTTFTKGGEIDWARVFFRYREIISQLSPEERANVYLVAPDVVGNPQATYELHQQLAPEIQWFMDQAVNVIMPMQKAEDVTIGESASNLSDLYQRWDRTIKGIPFNKAAWTEDEVFEYLQGQDRSLKQMRAAEPGFVRPWDIERVHLLGGGQAKVASLRKRLQDAGIEAVVTGDAFGGVARDRAYGQAEREGAAREQAQRPAETLQAPAAPQAPQVVEVTDEDAIEAEALAQAQAVAPAQPPQPPQPPAPQAPQAIQVRPKQTYTKADLNRLASQAGATLEEDAGTTDTRIFQFVSPPGTLWNATGSPNLMVQWSIDPDKATRDALNRDAISDAAQRLSDGYREPANEEERNLIAEDDEAAEPVGEVEIPPTPQDQEDREPLVLDQVDPDMQAFMDEMDEQIANMANRGVLRVRANRALNKGWITQRDYNEILRAAKDGTVDDGWSELTSIMVSVADDKVRQANQGGGNVAENELAFEDPIEETPTIREKKRQMRPEVARALPNAIIENLPIEELRRIRPDRAVLLRELYRKTPGNAELKAVAQMGAAGRFWYRHYRGMMQRAGLSRRDDEIFSGIVAATSPNKAVANNVDDALRIMQAWNDAGRPTGVRQVRALLRAQPRKVPISDFNNVVAVLTTTDMESAIRRMSDDSRKVIPFYRALMGSQYDVVLDTHMARLFGVRQAKLSKSQMNRALSARVRNVAKELGWTPAETQAAMWAVARHYGNEISNALNRIAPQRLDPIMAREVTNDELIRNDDIATLLTTRYAERFRQIGGNPDAARRELDRLRAASPADLGGGRGQTLAPRYQRSLARRFRDRFLADKAGRRGEGFNDRVAEQGEEYADRLEITDPDRRDGAVEYVAQVEENEADTNEAIYPTDEPQAERADTEAEIFLQTGIPTPGVRERLAQGERFSSVLTEHVEGVVLTFNIDGTIISGSRDFAATQLALRSPYQESIKFVFLDDTGQVVHSGVLSLGEISTAPFNVVNLARQWEIAQAKARAAGNRNLRRPRFMIAHNHPTGVTDPSIADIAVADVANRWAESQNGTMLDFLITDGDDFYSQAFGQKFDLVEPHRARWEAIPTRERLAVGGPSNAQKIASVLRQGNPEAEFILYLDTQNRMVGIEQVPSGMNRAGWVARATTGQAATGARSMMLITRQGIGDVGSLIMELSSLGFDVADASSIDEKSVKATKLIPGIFFYKPGAMSGVGESQQEFGFEETAEAAKPFPVTPPPPPPPPAAQPQSAIDEVVQSQAEPPPATVPLTQAKPSTNIPQFEVGDVSAESRESIDAEGLANLDNADVESAADYVPTRVLGRKFSVLGRRGGPEERARAISRAARIFDEAGLDVTYDEVNEVFRLADPTRNQEQQGQELVKILERELAQGSADGSPLLSTTINSIRQGDGGLWTAPGFSENTRNRLFSMAQGEASFYGLMLGALARAKRSLNFVAQHVDVYLHKAYSDAFGGETLGRVIDNVKGVAAGLLAGDLDRVIPDKMRGLLNRLDSMAQQGVDLDYFMGQVIDLIAKGRRVRPPRPELQQLPSLFDLANWRLFITQRGGTQLAEQILRLIRGETTTDLDGGVEGNVKRMDRLLQADLQRIVREVIPQIERQRNQPNYLQDLLTASGDLQSRTERMDVVDSQVRRGIDEAEERELAKEDSDPEEVAEKYELIREKWDEQFAQISGTLTSEQMARRILNQHLRPVLQRLSMTWADVLQGRLSVDRLTELVMREIEENFNAFNQQAPEAAIDPQRSAQLLNVLRNAFGDMARDKLDLLRARREAARIRRQQSLPQRTAQQELDRLAQIHSDVQAWTEPERNAVREAIQEQRKNPIAPEQFEDRLISLGVEVSTARTLSRIIQRDINARRRHDTLRREMKVASPAPERGDQQTQERRTGLKGLVDRIFAAPPQQQNDPRWQRRTALEYFQENGLTREEAEEAWNMFAPQFKEKLRQAARRGLEQMRKNLSRRERAAIGAKVGRVPLWQRLEKAINAGVFDQDAILKQFAKEFGWTIPSDAQIQALKALAIREQQLASLTEDERQRLGNDPQAVAKASMEKAAATLNERLRLQNQMHSLYAQFSRPINFRTPEGRRNAGEAGREFISANMLLKLGFGVKQVIDVVSQFAVHTPYRVISQAWARHQTAVQAGEPGNFFADVADGVSQLIDTLRQFDDVAITQSIQALRGEGVRRNIEGMRSTISGFDRMRAERLRIAQEIERRSLEGGPANLAAITALQAKRMILALMGFAEISLRFTRAMDNLQGVFVEQQEIRERLITEIMLNSNMTATEARIRATEILGDWRREADMAIFRTAEILAQNNLEVNKNDLRANAYELFKSRQYARMKAAGLDANQIQEHAETQRQTVGWNMREDTGIGGAIGAAVRGPARAIERLGIPLPLGQFSNAIAIGINRALTWTPIGFFPSWFGGVDEQGVGRNAWFRTQADRNQRKLEAATGTLGGGLFVALAASGLIRVWIKPPDDPEERELWQKEGHRAGTVEFSAGNGKFIPVSLTSGPMSFFRIPLTAIAAAQDVIDQGVRRRRNLEADARRQGIQVTDVPMVTMNDLSAAAVLGSFTAIMGGRTAGGAVRSLKAGTDRDSLTLMTAAAAQASPFIVGLPAYQEMQRALETRIDPAEANIIDLMFPTQGNDARRFNFLSDELGPGFIQQLTQTLSGGTYPGVVDPAVLDAQRPYQIFRKIDYRPSPIERNTGVIINGELRPLSPEEYRDAQFERGKIMKEMLQDVDPNQDPRVLTRWASRIAQISKQQALEGIRAQEVDELMAPEPEGMETRAHQVYEQIRSLPPDQQQSAFEDALADGRIPLQNGDVNPAFLEEWRTLTRQVADPAAP